MDVGQRLRAPGFDPLISQKEKKAFKYQLHLLMSITYSEGKTVIKRNLEVLKVSREVMVF